MTLTLTDNRIAVSDAAEFGRVAVLSGGHSSEREVSLDSGRAVLKALQGRGIDACGWDPASQAITGLASEGFDRVWIALHGPGGEDGTLQGALEWLEIPYTGSGVMASALAMDKIRSKRLFTAANIHTPDFCLISSVGDARLAASELGYPLIFKPSGQGSSVGMSKVFEAADLRAAAELALTFGSPALVEKCIVGTESTVAVLQGQALSSIRIETPRVFYDYRAKYEADDTEYFCPGSDDAELERRFHDLSIMAFDALGCSGWGRVDFMTGADGQPQVLEINTVPGMTSHSLVPMAAKVAGMSFDELCWRVLETSMPDEEATRTAGMAANDA